ncbi:MULTISPECIES: histidine kinase [unclassified Mycolicibacterium]|uniref:sensor histidine kinase n=1 Tax=unclassified Mycolicibacterium TaxID=2636767 RepID=UPI001EE4640F|nr:MULTISPECIES: histidine kinase [unclassified Mycolicibacterium]
MMRSRVDRTLTVVIYAASLFLFAMAWATIDATYAAPSGLRPAIAALAALPLIAIRPNPLLGWAMSATAALALPLTCSPIDSAFPWQMVHVVVLLALLVAVTVRCPRAAATVAWLSTGAVLLVNSPIQTGVGFAVGMTVVVLVGLLMRELSGSRRQLATQREISELERARRAVLEERAQVARDLHDVIAHHMSVVVVQAQSAPYRLASVTEETKAEFDAIGANVRASLNEIRAVLGVLRSDDESAELRPQPGIAGIRELIENSRRAGVDVSFNTFGEPLAVPELCGVVLYRIVQESLANAVRHSPGAPVTVTMEHGSDATTVTVRNAPAAVPRPDGMSAGGSGIAGMRERAAAIGGTVDARRLPDGGFEVHARIPATIPPTPEPHP